MTVEAFSPALPVLVSGIGPYPVPFPYAVGAVVLVVVKDGLRTVLDPADYAVDPPDTTTAGTVTLTAGAAAAHDGAVLHVQRGTAIEQGWQGVTAREIGLERQLDALAMGLQERAEEAGRSVRTMGPQPVLLPEPGKSLMWDNQGRIVAGPDTVNLAAAEQILSDAAAARDLAVVAAAEVAIRFFPSVAAFNAVTIPLGVDHVLISNADEMLIYRRYLGAAGPGDLTHSSGQVWRRATVTQADVDEAVAGAVAPLNEYAGAPGTFTPGITFASPGTLSVSYGYRYGWYQRVGNTVFAAVNINPATITKGTASGNLRISFSDLPFTPSASSMGSGVIRAKNQYLLPPAGTHDLTLIVVPGQKYVEIAGFENSGGMVYATAPNVLDGNLILQLRFQFEVAAVTDDDPAVHPGYFAFTREQLEMATDPVAYGQNLILVLEGGYAVPYVRTPFATDLICGDMSTWAKAGITVSDAVQIGTEVANSVASLSDGLRNIPDGDAAAPGWKFSLDLDTGVYRPGSNQIAFATNGVSRAVLSDTGFSVSVPVTGDAVQQSATDVTPGRLMRADYGYSRGNILGTVSQTGGVPTGAIIESGTAAGGRYIKYANGTMICWHIVSAALTADVQIGATGNYRPSVPYTWTFPQGFVGSTPHVTGSSRTYLEIGYGRGLSLTQGSIDICRLGSAASAASAIEMMAIGRWY